MVLYCYTRLSDAMICWLRGRFQQSLEEHIQKLRDMEVEIEVPLAEDVPSSEGWFKLNI